MSYTEYLRRKAATQPVVLDTRKNTDASEFIREKRLDASSRFYTSSRRGVINNTTDITSDPLKAPVSYTKSAGGRVPDASAFTAYVGSTSRGETAKNARVTLNSSAAGSLSGCCVAPVLGAAPKNASSITKEIETCRDRLGESHVANELSPALFVDNTIRLKHLADCCAGTKIEKAIHTHPAVSPIATWAPRPQYAVIGPDRASPGDARKVGGALRNIPYVEKHHGNDTYAVRRTIWGFPTAPPDSDIFPARGTRTVNIGSLANTYTWDSGYLIPGDLVLFEYLTTDSGTLTVTLSNINGGDVALYVSQPGTPYSNYELTTLRSSESVGFSENNGTANETVTDSSVSPSTIYYIVVRCFANGGSKFTLTASVA